MSASSPTVTASRSAWSGPAPRPSRPRRSRASRSTSRWDQSGCLSPVVLHLVGLEARARETFAHRLAEALDALGRQLPRGALALGGALERRERSEARMRTASGAGLLIEGSDHTVVLEPDPTSRPAPLGRFVRLVPIASVAALDAALRPASRRISPRSPWSDSTLQLMIGS
ncbi:MAG: acyl-CoA reductase [Myxococcota bacterium]